MEKAAKKIGITVSENKLNLWHQMILSIQT
jgi:hypothetical protein